MKVKYKTLNNKIGYLQKFDNRRYLEYFDLYT